MGEEYKRHDIKELVEEALRKRFNSEKLPKKGFSGILK